MKTICKLMALFVLALPFNNDSKAFGLDEVMVIGVPTALMIMSSDDEEETPKWKKDIDKQNQEDLKTLNDLLNNKSNDK